VVSGGTFGADFDSTRLGTKGQVVSTQGTVNDRDQILQTTGSGQIPHDGCAGRNGYPPTPDWKRPTGACVDGMV
jgi:hypothetical protein